MKRQIDSFDAIRFQQGVGLGEGQEMYLFAAPAKWLIRRTSVDSWDPNVDDADLDRQGYQRNLVDSHVRKVARYLLQTGKLGESTRVLPVFPTSILLSVRRSVDFERANQNNATEHSWAVPGRLYLPEQGISLFIIDGQHRIAGLRRAFEDADEEQQASLSNYWLPVTLMVCKNKLHELHHFYTINKMAKSVRTDLAERLIEMVRVKDGDLLRDPSVRDAANERARALAIVKFLEETKGQPWFGRIAKPNERRRGEKVAGESQLTKSLRHICSAAPFFWPEEKLRKFVVDFWKALAQLLPEAFAKPREYIIQGAVGFGCLHQVLPNLVPVYKNVSTLKKALEGVEPFFTDAKYWVRRGVAAQYSSEGGYKRHATLIKSALREKSGVS